MRVTWNASLGLACGKVLSTFMTLAAGLALPTAALAQTVELPEEFSKLVTATSQVKGLNTGLAGDEVNLYSGSLGFTQTDISVPGNSALPVEVTRRLSTGQGSDGFHGFFGDWDLSIPSIHGVFPLGSKWAFGTGAIYGTRCSNYEAPPDVVGQQGGEFSAGEYWQGTFVYLPGKGDQELLVNPGANARPTGGRAYALALADGSAVSCLASLAGGSNPSVGEGFEIVTRDGTRYRFDHMTTRSHSTLHKSSPAPQALAASRSSVVTPQAYNGYLLYRNEYVLYPTQATDRFGNTVTYNWNPSNANQLQSITSSDGRSITFTYTDAAGYQIQSASSAGRTWSYSYTGSSLVQATLPDQSAWKFSLYDLVLRTPGQRGQCDQAIGGSNSYTGTVTHPSGAKVTFGLRAIQMGRTWVPRECLSVDGMSQDSLYAYFPKEVFAMALVSKTVQGPGLPSAGYSWSYAYDGTAGCWDPTTVPASATAAPKCTSSTSGVRTTTVTNPDGSTNRLVYGNRFRVNEGQLLTQQSGVSGSNALRTETRTYAAPDAGPYPSYIGYSIQSRGDGEFASRYHPLSQRVTQQDGVSFSWSTTFDAFARPSQITRSGPSGTVTEKNLYADNLALWVMDQPLSVTNLGTGLVNAAGEYNSLGQLTKTYAFGRLTGTYGYGPGGVLSTLTDPNNRTTTFSNWKRGIPQSVGYADGAGQSAVVNDAGWITSRTDELSYQYGFTYDAMGRLASISYPSDGVAANPTTQLFEPVGSAEVGLAAGHWRQTVATGNARKVTYYDGLWRPIVTREYDSGNEAGTAHVQRLAYDHEGRTIFASYPGITDSLNTGTWTSYDALGRVTSVGQDTELNPSLQLATTTYLAGFKAQVTNPRGGVTTTSYMAYDQPSTDFPIKVEAPEGAVTEIARDVFGKPTAIVRRDSGNTINVTRSYNYNAYQQLCRSVEPETGASLVGYDAAGNVAWSAAGLPSTQACDEGSNTAVAARKVSRSYDARNRLNTLSFPDGKGNQSWTYTADSKPYQVTTYNANGAEAVINIYAYNARRQLAGEGMTQAGQSGTLSIGYGYDANGSLASHVYPSGLSVAYAPNALGQPTQAGTFATGVSYYPNGAIKQFTYGNGVVHTMTQNARQLPARSTDTGAGAVMDMAYSFDANGNVGSVTDYVVNGHQTRSMTYDGLDRLRTTQSVMFGGDNQAAFTYDVLDNLKTFKVGSAVNYQYNYNSKQQLELASNLAAGGQDVGIGYDAQGNVVNRNGQLFNFDYGNRLRAATNKESYRYDANGTRVLSTASNGQITSLYGQDGVLRYQKNQRTGKNTDYIYLGGSLVARANNVQAIGVPTATVASTNSSGTYTVSWTSVSDATAYQAQEKVGSGSWTQVQNSAAVSYVATGKTNNAYSYRVQACVNSSCGSWSNEASVAVYLTPQSAPFLTLPSEIAGSSFQASWTAIPNAVTYKLWRDAVAEFGEDTQVYEGSALSTTVSGLSPGRYTYHVTACNPGGCGPDSASKTVVVTAAGSGAPAVPSGVVITYRSRFAQYTYTATWGSVAGAYGYQVKRGDTATIASTLTPSFGFSSPYAGISIQVRSCTQAAVCSDWSPVVNSQLATN